MKDLIKQVEVPKGLRKKIIKTVLGGNVALPKTADTKKPKVAKDDPEYTKRKKLGLMPNEKIKVGGKELMLIREGTTDKALGKMMISNAPREQKDAMVAQYLFERGKESGSFLAELFMSKGAHTKETRTFKSQMRFDFEEFSNIIVILLNDISDGIKKKIREPIIINDKEIVSVELFFGVLDDMSKQMKQGADMIVERLNKIKEARMAEKGYGIYVDNAGRPYSVLDKDLDEVIKKDREATKEALEDNK